MRDENGNWSVGVEAARPAGTVGGTSPTDECPSCHGKVWEPPYSMCTRPYSHQWNEE